MFQPRRSLSDGMSCHTGDNITDTLVAARKTISLNGITKCCLVRNKSDVVICFVYFGITIYAFSLFYLTAILATITFSISTII